MSITAQVESHELFGSFDAASRIGESIADKWRLDEVLGVGGMAAVYGATHRNGHRVAIKMLLPEIARDESLVQRFLREGYIANKVAHDGAVRVLDDGRTEDGSAFLVMERLEGHSLDEHLRGARPPLDTLDALDAMVALLEVLDVAHAAGVVHRDIKPANIFKTTRGELKLLDLGIAVLVESSMQGGRATQTGAVIGTPAFMSPEQARGRRELVGPRSDLWALAATGLCLMLGRRLRNAVTSSEELAMAALQPLPPVDTLSNQLGGPYGQVLDKALSFEPRDRFASASEMRTALVDCRAGVTAAPLFGRDTQRMYDGAPTFTQPSSIQRVGRAPAMAATMVAAVEHSPSFVRVVSAAVLPPAPATVHPVDASQATTAAASGEARGRGGQRLTILLIALSAVFVFVGSVLIFASLRRRSGHSAALVQAADTGGARSNPMPAEPPPPPMSSEPGAPAGSIKSELAPPSLTTSAPSARPLQNGRWVGLRPPLTTSGRTGKPLAGPVSPAPSSTKSEWMDER